MHEQTHELALLRRNLATGLRIARSLFAQTPQKRGLAEGDAPHVFLQIS